MQENIDIFLSSEASISNPTLQYFTLSGQDIAYVVNIYIYRGLVMQRSHDAVKHDF